MKGDPIPASDDIVRLGLTHNGYKALPIKYASNFQFRNKMSKVNETSDNQQNGNDFIADVRQSAFAVIPDAERLDIGSNKIIAVFQHRHQAEDWAKSMWEKYYIIEEVSSPHFA